jgi:hypothetical protein
MTWIMFTLYWFGIVSTWVSNTLHIFLIFFWKYLCPVVLNKVKFILYSSVTNPLERGLSVHTRKRWCACLHVTSRFYEIDIDASCQWNKCGFEISWLWHENTVFYFPTISMYCCSKLGYIYSIFIVYYSAGMIVFLDTLLKKGVVFAYTWPHDFTKLT